jgi:hypothetical protein
MISKLFNIRCDNCGAEYRINSRGEMNCPFCGSKIYLNDKDFAEYLKTRDEMLLKDKVNNDLVNSTGDVLHKWNNEHTKYFTTKNGKTVNLKYFYQYSRKGKTVYVGRNRLTIVYKNPVNTDTVINRLNRMQYPSADIKGLSEYFPIINMVTELDDGTSLMVIDKPENVYPLALFNKLDPKQVAWIISRLENFGCLFEYNEADFSKIEKLDLYINPKTHQVYLLDGWEFMYFEAQNTGVYLRLIRDITKDLMYLDRAPQMCIDFLDSEPTNNNAYDDFNSWDAVIMKGFGGHNFHHFTEE